MYEDDDVEKLSKKIGDVAFAIQASAKINLMLMSYIQK
jgi:hypothetical protein